MQILAQILWQIGSRVDWFDLDTFLGFFLENSGVFSLKLFSGSGSPLLS